MKKRLIAVISALLLLVMLLPVTALAAPLPPGNLAAAVQPGPEVTLTWNDNSLNEVGFRVFRALAPSTDFADITGLGLPANSVSFTDNTVTAGVTYSYQVVAFNFDVPTAESAPSNTVTITATIPAPPSGLGATQQEGPPQTVTLSWTDASNNEIGFKIERADDTDFTLNPVENVVGANAVNFVDTDIIPGNTYFYRVSALNTGGATAPSNVATITVSAAAGMLAGPVAPIAGFPTPNGYPLYYQDILNTRLSMLPIGPENLADPPDPLNPYAVELGFGAEAFYYVAEAEGVPGLAEFAVEAVWDNVAESPNPGDEAVQNRVRLRLEVPVSGDYSVETPYGTFDFLAVVAGVDGWDINFTQDILGFGQDFDTAATGPVNVFLRPTTEQPAGLLGNGPVGTVTGAPGQITSVTITGPTGVIATTNQWAIFGRLLSAPVTPSFLTNINPATRTINVNDTSAGTPTNWLWDFGDGATSIAQNPGHTYAAAGNFIVKLTTGNAGGTASASQMVSIFTQPSADFTTSFGATPFTVNFTSSTAGNPTGWMWDFGDGTTSTLQNPSHVYTTAGAVTVMLSVFNPVGTATASQDLVVGPPPMPTDVTGVVVSPTQIDLSWTDNSLNETGFRVERAENITFTLNPLTRDVAPSPDSGLTVTLNDTTGITTNKIFFYRVTAFNTISQSPVSAIATVQVGSAPAGPTNFTATLVDADPVTAGVQLAIKLDWTDNANNEEFNHLHRAPTADFVPAQVTHNLLPPDTITFTDTNIAEGETFFYFIHAMNPLGESPNSPIIEISTTVPAAPTGLTAAVASTTQVDLNWTADPTASGYIIERSDNGGAFAALPAGTVDNVTTFSDMTVTVGNTFTYRIFATNLVGISAAPSATAAVDMSAPVAPVLVDPAIEATGEIVLSWNNVANETGYRIERATSVGGVADTFAQIAEVGVDVTTYTDITALPATEYQYQVTAFNGLGASVSNAVTVTSATPTAPPAAPTVLTESTQASATQVNLSWTDNASNESGFRIERSSDNFTTVSDSFTVTANAVSFSDTTVTASTEFFYRVFALNVIGDSGASNVLPVTTPAAPPSGGSGGGGGGGGGGTLLTSVALDQLSSSPRLRVDGNGNVLNSVTLTTEDGLVSLDIAGGTTILGADGNALSFISASDVTELPAPPAGNAIIFSYHFGPDGVSFDPALILTINYDPGMLPGGAIEDELYIAFWDGSAWLSLVSTVDTGTNMVSAEVSHFTSFAVISKLPVPEPAVTERIQVTGKLGIGDYLNDAEGMTLYYFTRDVPGVSNCNSEGCVAVWPIFYAAEIEAPAGLSQADFGTITRNDGSPQTTYKDWPLYYFANDTAPGDTNGEGLRDVWYVIKKPFYSVMIMTEEEVGNYLSDAEGMTLYYFTRDSADTSTVAGQVLATWSVFYSQNVIIPSALNAADFGSITRDDGAMQTTYKGWPVYYFVGDQAAGDTNGQGLNDIWFVVDEAVEAAPPAPAPTPTPTPIPAPTPTPTPTPVPAPEAPPLQTNWWLIGGLIVAVIIVAGSATYYLRHRRLNRV